MFRNKKNTTEAVTTVEETKPIVNETKETPVSKTIIGKDVCFEGEFITEEDIVVKGSIKGNVTSSATVYVDQEGEIDVKLKGDVLDVAGTAKGTLVTNSETKIEDTGSIIGDLTTKKLSTSENSYFEGSLHLPAFARKRAEAKARLEANEDATEIKF